MNFMIFICTIYTFLEVLAMFVEGVFRFLKFLRNNESYHCAHCEIIEKNDVYQVEYSRSFTREEIKGEQENTKNIVDFL